MWTYEDVSNVSIRVYMGLTALGCIESGIRSCERDVILDLCGYCTVEFDAPVTLREGGYTVSW